MSDSAIIVHVDWRIKDLVEFNLRSWIHPVARAIFNVLDLNREDAHVSKKQSITVVTDCIRFEIFADSTDRLLSSRDRG